MAMLTYFCEGCGSKFQSDHDWISQPCQNIVNNDYECGFPLAPIISLKITGIEKEREQINTKD